MTDDLLSYTIDPALQPDEREDIRTFLAKCGLDYEIGVEAFVVFRRKRHLVACAGLEKNIVKCTAIDPEMRGEALGLRLLTELIHLAQDRGHSHLFLYTKPDCVEFFRSCGFYLLAEVPGLVALMENTPIGVKAYCDRLKRLRRPGAVIGAVVMNANPFTRGHRYLVERAAAACDWLHVFVVAEDVSLISYRDRYALVSSGIADIPRVTLHHGSEYMVSRATFSAYFFKEKGIVGDCCTAIDLLIFRDHIAPALGITHRFVGTEPFCPTTFKYNADMRHWLRGDVSPSPAVEVVEIDRTECEDVPISASEVRRLLAADDFARIRRLVPATTLELLETKYRAPRSSAA
ncbi:[citrate (pro-3S)-lyase] ligase [Rhodoplanes roseus]|uniref:[Citrate [pro-3S]-lyase] ligase n=1 Tax=Rhodoplanes roseus TaxID=29409 RepID=A0A327KXH3_9BRAD|nr:[citrate (pro-3S)-lyase] ligase [Rhodoplanes roseus]RAI42403.1 [citrate (pro-3S)-lyase] ligase [Rhodoplanes roseus]